MTRLNSAPPVGFIAASELMREPHSFLRSGLPLRHAQGTMPSVPPWRDLLTRDVAIRGAAGFVMRCCLFRGSLEDSYPPTASGHAGFLVIRVNPFRILLISFLPHGKQISPDKDVNFPCTTAAFTLPPEPAGFVVLCQLAQELSLVCPAHWRDPAARTFALRLPSDLSSRGRPCLRLVLLVVFISLNTIGSRTGDFLPRRSLWRRQVTP